MCFKLRSTHKINASHIFLRFENYSPVIHVQEEASSRITEITSNILKV